MATTNSQFPILPVELVGFIIEEALAASDVGTTSSIAQVSHSFRIYANKRRFSTITFSPKNCKNVGVRIKAFRKLIDSEMSIQTMQDVRITSFISSLIVDKIDSHVMASDSEVYGSLATIMRNLFRSPFEPTGCLSVGEQTFTLRYLNRNPPFDWRDLDSNFRSAFHYLCRTSMLTTLELESISNIPRGLLKGSTIKHLIYQWLEFLEDAEKDDVSDDGPVLIESLTTDHTVSHFEILNDLSLSPKLACSRLTNLKSCITSAESFLATAAILTVADFLEFVTLVYYEHPSDIGFFPLKFGHLVNLKTLAIEYPISNGEYPTELSDLLINLLGTVILPSLTKILIVVSESKENVIAQGLTVKDMLSRLNLQILINHFSGPQFRGVKSIEFEVDFEIERVKNGDICEFEGEVSAYFEEFWWGNSVFDLDDTPDFGIRMNAAQAQTTAEQEKQSTPVMFMLLNVFRDPNICCLNYKLL